MNTVEKRNEERAQELRATAKVNEILRVRVGSHLHGTNTPASDTDIKTVWVPTKRHLLGISNIKQIDFTYEEDGKKVEGVAYPLHLFCGYLLKCNPTMMEVVYANEKNIQAESLEGVLLRKYAGLFLNKQACLDNFMGYAASQRKKLTYKLERMTGFMEAIQKANDWKKLGHTELPERLTIKASTEREFWRIYEKSSPVDQVIIDASDKLNEYGWRKELVQKYGYDTKFSANLVRLLTQAHELFIHGYMTFPLREKELVREVREGKYTLSGVLEISEYWETMVEQAYQGTSMREEADVDTVENLMLDIYERVWARGD